MDFAHSLTLAFQKLGITSQEAKTYVTLFQKAGVEQLDDLKRKFLYWYRYIFLTNESNLVVQTEAKLEKLGITKAIHLKKISRFAENPVLKQHEVFISHVKRETGAEATLFFEKLNVSKFEVFLDVESMFPRNELMKLVQRSEMLLILLSP